jgi:NAD(P)-dependent dehydrogenase (short-subunit alcohol dehydrogenase family)
MTPRSLDGKVALVTGGARGIGRAHAGLLAERGAAVVLNDLGTGIDGGGRDPSAAQAAVGEIEASGGRVIADDHDISTFDGAAAAVRHAVEAFGRIDVVVNNAGILGGERLGTVDERTLQRLWSVHFIGAVGTARAALPHMAAQGGGRIVNTVSEVALDPRRGGGGAYGAAKAAVWSATLWMAEEGRPHGVTANALSPGALTRMNEAMFAEQGGPPPGLDLDPGHVARVAAWLASDEAADVTGRIIHVAGGHVREYRVDRLADTPLTSRLRQALDQSPG